MKRLLCIAVWSIFGLMLVCQTASASITFTSNATYSPGSSPMFRGGGTWTVEQAPLGSGLPMPSPTNLIDGFIGGMDTIFRYVAAAEDVGTSVVVSWVIEREFEFLAIGEFVTDHSQFSLTAQLLDGKGRSASTFFEMGTSAGNGPQQSAVASPGGTRTLSETGEIEYIAAEGFGRSSPAFPTESGGYRLTQSIGFSVQPTAAGQEFLIHLGGAVSEVFSSGGGDGTVPEPSSIAIWGGIGLVSLIARWRRKRRQSVAG